MKPMKLQKMHRAMDAAVRAAGGEVVRVTREGHLRVKGPKGVATVASHDLSHSRGLANTVSCLARHAGLQVQL